MRGVRSFEYPEAKNVVVCGDIHGEFGTLVNKLCIQYRMEDTLLIVAGDCGFGFEKPEYYEQIYNRVVGRLRKANNWVVFVRGNHDDPSYFNEEKISHRRWRTVPDYSVISACGHAILCVGGAISIDRSYRRIEQYLQNLKETGYYWINEAPYYDSEKLDALADFSIDTVVTHTAPSFCEKKTKRGLSGWAENDPDLYDDLKYERAVMDRLLNELRDRWHPVLGWYYGHFHDSWTGIVEGIKYRMLDILEICEVI